MDNWLSEYALALSQLNSENLSELSMHLADEVEFRDPFTHTFTHAEFIQVLDDMFYRLDNVRFDIHSHIQNDHLGVLQWTFYASNKYTGEIQFDGMSQVFADQEGKVTYHCDYWDASALMEKVPLMGRVIGFMRKRMSHQKAQV